MSLLRRFKSRRVSLATAHREELLSLCRSRQINDIMQSRHMRRDVGLDCGCDNLPFQKPWLP